MPEADSSLPESPLAPCPGTPNCERVSRGYDVSADRLRIAAIDALRDLGPAEIDTDSLHAVYRVVIFKDDVHLAVAEHASGSVLHVRSASRVGRSDLGVNARRVARFFRALDRRLE